MGPQRILLSIVCLLSLVDAADARTYFRTDELAVNTYTTNMQFAPAVIAGPDGSFVIAWSSIGQEGGAEAGAGVFARRYDPNAMAADIEYVVNAHTTNSQYQSAIARSSSGEQVVVWIGYDPEDKNFRIYGQWLDSGGARHGPEFSVDPDDGTQVDPAVTVGPDGTALVVYRRFEPSAGGNQIFARFVDASGVPQATAFQVSTYTGGYQSLPDICTRPDGQFVVVWQNGFIFESPRTQDGSGPGVFAQIVSSAGERIGPEFQVNVATTYAQFAPDVACTDDDAFVVTWGGFDPAHPAAAEGVFARRFEATGDATGPEILINAHTDSRWSIANDTSPAIATREDGGFVVVWADYLSDTGKSRIVGKLLSESGAPSSKEFVVSRTYSDVTVYEPQIDGTGDEFVVTWTNAPGFEARPYVSADGDEGGIFARKFAVYPKCGDAVVSGSLTSADALVALHSAVSLAVCDACVCDVDSSGATTTTDALAILQRAISLPIVLSCADCR